MRFNTSLPPSECIKRLSGPTSHPPRDIKEIIDAKYGSCFSTLEKKSEEGKHIYTEVDGNEFSVYFRQWGFRLRPGGLFNETMAGFVGKICDDGKEGSVIECRLNKCHYFTVLYIVALLWLAFLVPSILYYKSSADYWSVFLLLFGITIFFFALGMQSCSMLLEFIKDLLEIPCKPKTDLHKQIRSQKHIRFDNTKCKWLVMKFNTDLSASKCLALLVNPAAHVNKLISEEYSSCIMPDIKSANGNRITTEVSGCDFGVFYGSRDVKGRERHEKALAVLNGRIIEGETKTTIIECRFKCGAAFISSSISFGIILVCLIGSWYSRFPDSPYGITVSLIAMGIFCFVVSYFTLRYFKLIVGFVKELLEVNSI